MHLITSGTTTVLVLMIHGLSSPSKVACASETRRRILPLAFSRHPPLQQNNNDKKQKKVLRQKRQPLLTPQIYPKNHFRVRSTSPSGADDDCDNDNDRHSDTTSASSWHYNRRFCHQKRLKRSLVSLMVGASLFVSSLSSSVLLVTGAPAAAADAASLMEIPQQLPQPQLPQQPHHSNKKKLRYYQIQESGTVEEKIAANAALVEFEVGTIHTMYYDPSGGAYFEPTEFALSMQKWLKTSTATANSNNNGKGGEASSSSARTMLSSRSGTVETLKQAVAQLGDPYSKYLTREELYEELKQDTGGFLGLGAVVEAEANTNAPKTPTSLFVGYTTTAANPVLISNYNSNPLLQHHQQQQQQLPNNAGAGKNYLSVAEAVTLPVVTAVAPDSPAERDGVTVGDRIVGVVTQKQQALQKQAQVPQQQQEQYASLSSSYHHHPYYGSSSSSSRVDSFLSKTPGYISKRIEMYYATGTTKTTGSSTSSVLELILAKPVLAVAGDRDVVVGYRATRVPVPTSAAAAAATTTAEAPHHHDHHQLYSSYSQPPGISSSSSGGNAFVHYELLRDSIFDHRDPSFAADSARITSVGGGFSNNNYNMPLPSSSFGEATTSRSQPVVGYVRLTRFSRASTASFVQAVEAMEKAGATSLILDLRNNYGGIVQEAMLTASSLLRDPHAVLCYTINSRGGFTPHDVEEYILDKRYPGYLWSSEPKDVSFKQVQRENPEIFEEDGIMWVPPSSFQSLHEQMLTRGIHRPGLRVTGSNSAVASWTAYSGSGGGGTGDNYMRGGGGPYNNRKKEKNIVLLVNEGTASSAEVFASALHDNGRTVALIGTKTYGKGLIQHTFPMPDGGGLRLTVAEYLTPALHHVTHVGGANFDPRTGERIGGGIQPDIYCESKQGIPGNVGADLCVGMALDALEEADSIQQQKQQSSQGMNIRWANTGGGSSG